MYLNRNCSEICKCFYSYNLLKVQHHDGITGTESPKVADMYMKHLTQAMMKVDELLAALFLLPHNLNLPNNLNSNYHRTGTWRVVGFSVIPIVEVTI